MKSIWAATVLVSVFTAVAITASTTAASVPADSAMTLKGDQDGTVLKSMTVEGEDRIQVKFEKPRLDISLDPLATSGLDWRQTWRVIDRGLIDLVTPFVSASSVYRSPYRARPWLSQLRTQNVARFHPQLEDVERWSLVIANSKGATVAVFDGKGKPPKEIAWDGRDLNGEPVTPGLTYSYVLEAFDKAGNKRNFVGEGFELSAYLLEAPDRWAMMFSGGELGEIEEDDSEPAALLLEIATRINQMGNATQPVQIDVTARSYTQAQTIAQRIVDAIRPNVLGDPSRIKPVTSVAPDAPELGTVGVFVSKTR